MSPEAHEPFDPGFGRGLVEQVFDPLLDHYFRPRLLGRQRIPERGPVILAPNHSGNAFPYDAMILDSLLWKRDGLAPERKFRSLFEKELSQTWWMRPFGLDDFWRRCGGVDITFDNFERMIQRGDRLIYYPEGVRGIGKGFNRRYQLQRFHTSFAVLAMRHRVPVVPVHVVNAEWIVPFSFTLRPVDRLMQRLFHVPFLPLPAAPLGILFPWAWWMALPARLVFVVGEPIDVRAVANEEGLTDCAWPDRTRLNRVAARIRQSMQGDLDRAVARYGRRPYQLRSLYRHLRKARKEGVLGRAIPTGWIGSFLRYERNRSRTEPRNRLTAIGRDWDMLGYYLPCGWPLLSMTRNWRRPPCGYRGVEADARRTREGRYVWHLAERPLPPRARS
jgi:1-acyl-sn-glycerol-3-phosphate acyltransferase